MSQLPKKWTDEELEESIRTIGPLLPIYVSGGFTLDGKRRQALCIKHGKRFTIEQVSGEARILKVLWANHPERALERIGEGRTLQEYSEALGLKPSQVALVRQALKGPPSTPETRRGYRSRTESIVTRGHRLNVRMPPSAKALIKEAADSEHRTVSDFIRRASIEQAKAVLGPGRAREVLAGARHLDSKGPIVKNLRLVNSD